MELYIVNLSTPSFAASRFKKNGRHFTSNSRFDDEDMRFIAISRWRLPMKHQGHTVSLMTSMTILRFGAAAFSMSIVEEISCLTRGRIRNAGVATCLT